MGYKMSEEMTLLDMFAMSAASKSVGNDISPKQIAQTAYLIASEMMRERKKYINSGEENNG